MEYFSPLQENNVKDVAAIDRECFTGEAWTESLFREEIGESSKYYAVFSVDNVVVGFGAYAHILDEGHILNIAVKPSCQQKGFGKKILEKMISHGKENGINAFTLEVRVSNFRARALYERMGFRNVGIRKGFYPDKEDACIYWLYL